MTGAKRRKGKKKRKPRGAAHTCAAAGVGATRTSPHAARPLDCAPHTRPARSAPSGAAATSSAGAAGDSAKQPGPVPAPPPPLAAPVRRRLEEPRVPPPDHPGKTGRPEPGTGAAGSAPALGAALSEHEPGGRRPGPHPPRLQPERRGRRARSRGAVPRGSARGRQGAGSPSSRRRPHPSLREQPGSLPSAPRTYLLAPLRAAPGLAGAPVPSPGLLPEKAAPGRAPSGSLRGWAAAPPRRGCGLPGARGARAAAERGRPARLRRRAQKFGR